MKFSRFEEIGVDERTLLMQLGSVPHGIAMEAIRTFADEVMPDFGAP